MTDEVPIVDIGPEDFEAFRQAIAKIDYLNSINNREDDNFLTKFLKSAKGDVKKACKRYVEYYKLVESFPKIETSLDGDIKWILDILSDYKKQAGSELFMNCYGEDAHG